MTFVPNVSFINTNKLFLLHLLDLSDTFLICASCTRLDVCASVFYVNDVCMGHYNEMFTLLIFFFLNTPLFSLY